jgi:tetratricopeptide (TPR) repeat protein
MNEIDPRPGSMTGPDPLANIPSASVRRPAGGVSPLVWLMLGVLSLLALAVVFVLPGVVAEYELPFTPRVEVNEVLPETMPSSPGLVPISPFEEAQRARQRQEAQAVLASLLGRQAELEEQQVNEWAPEAYAAALEAARRGDEAYRTQDFSQATLSYQESDTGLQLLQDSIPEVFAGALSAGLAAIEAGDADLAIIHLNLALALQAGDVQAQTAMRRAETLNDVIALLNAADQSVAAGDLSAAQSNLEQASGLDSSHAGVRERLQQVRTQISDNAFSRVMSEGFAALQAGNSQAAIAAFERALSMRPGSSQAQEAIIQTRDQLAVAEINVHRNGAAGFEAQEQWEAAVAEYDAALAIDANLVFALEGRDYALKRLQLDRLLQDAMDRPQRLADTAVHAQVVQIYYTGLQLENPGPRLQGQLSTVEDLLNRAQVPVEVELLSDNITEVTLYQVGVLGRFQSQVLSLKPGSYVAVGTRPGYRDVRTEFVVGFDQGSDPVTVACTEEVVAVNRR